MDAASARPGLDLRDSDAVDPVSGEVRRGMQAVHWADLFLSMDRFLVELAHHYGPFVYVALALIYMMQTGLVFMAFLPGDSLLFVAGAVAASGQYRLDLLMFSLVVGTVLGNMLNFWLGAWLGRKVFDGNVRWINQDSLDKTVDFFERHGGKTVIVALFLPLLRSFAPLVAGAMGMRRDKFQLYSGIGAMAWIGLFTGGGYLFGKVPLVRDHLGMVLILGLLAALAGPLLVAALWRLIRGRGQPLRSPRPLEGD
jgi:membrane-associated protein